MAKKNARPTYHSKRANVRSDANDRDCTTGGRPCYAHQGGDSAIIPAALFCLVALPAICGIAYQAVTFG